MRNVGAFVLCVWVAACTGSIGQEGDLSGPGMSGGNGARRGNGGGGRAAGAGGHGDGNGGPGGSGSGGSPGGDGDGMSPGEQLPAPGTRFARLTHAQWNRSVNDLLGLPTAEDHTSDLRNDPSQSGFLFDNQGGALVVDQALWTGYQRVAGELAARVAGDTALIERLAPPDADAAARMRTFVRDFGLHAHRRPLTTTEQDAYEALFMRGAELFPNTEPFTAGVRLVVEAALQSPHFLYRTELSEAEADGVIPLSDYEVASRLSYLLWNTMPDDTLLDAAAAGQLSDPARVRAQAQRMLADAQAAEMVVDFHRQLLDADKYGTIKPSPTFYDVSAALPEYALQETERFVREVIYGDGGGLQTLLTSRDTFVNAELAAIYGLGLDIDDSTWMRVTLDRRQRAGVLTQVGFLASNATGVNPDPIHRGKFVAERMSCMHINAPPADIPPLPDLAGRTNRQAVEDHTEDPDTVCATCHATIINPYGFPFESFDAIGAFRTTDMDQPVDTATEPYINGMRVPVADAVALAEALAGSEEVHDCYAKHWIEYAQGRPEEDADDALRQALTEASLAGDDVRALLMQLVQSRSFLTRATEEVQ